MSVEIQIQSTVTVAEMARMLGLSRSRFYQLKGKAFPAPHYDPKTKRPYYPEDLQRVCLEVRRKNCGIDGKPILFYAKGSAPLVRKPSPASKPDVPTDLIQGLKALGLNPVTSQVVNAALKELFPKGTSNMDQGEVLRAVFVHLKRQNSADNVGR
jgi:hypothetical protein